MAIFAVILLPNPKRSQLSGVIQETFPDAFKLDGDAGFLVQAATSAQNLCDQLGISDGRNGSALIVEVASYFGRGNPNTWVWLREKTG